MRPNPAEAKHSGKGAAKPAHSFLSAGISVSNSIMKRLEGTGPILQLYGKKGLVSLVPIKDLAKDQLHRDPPLE